MNLVRVSLLFRKNPSILFLLKFNFSQCTTDFFLVSVFFLCWKEGKFHYQTGKGRKKFDYLPRSKVDFNIQFSLGMKTITYWFSFFKLGYFYEKKLWNSKNFEKVHSNFAFTLSLPTVCWICFFQAKLYHKKSSEWIEWYIIFHPF